VQRTLLLVHHRNSLTQTFNEPFEFFYDGTSPTMIGEKLSETLSIPKEQLLVAHYQWARDCWELLFYGESTEVSVNPATPQAEEKVVAPQGKRRKNRQWIPDGSIVVTKNLWEDMDNADDFTATGIRGEQKLNWDEGQGVPQPSRSTRGGEIALKIFVPEDEYEWVTDTSSEEEDNQICDTA